MYKDIPSLDPAPFWAKVARSGDTDCWPWLGAYAHNGYGRYNQGKHVQYTAHRVAYTLAIGPIPDGLQLDHLCRNRICVNPAHLEPVTLQVNVARGDVGRHLRRAVVDGVQVCKKGHPIVGDNARVRRAYPHLVSCIQCDKDRMVRWKARQMEAAA